MTFAPACMSCGSRLDLDQRYCITCGHRRGELPPRVRQLLGIDPPPPVVPPYAEPTIAIAQEAEGWRLPRPRAVAVAVLALLGFGTIIGGAVSPAATPSRAPVIVAVAPPAAAPVATPAPEPVVTDDGGGAVDTTVPDTVVAAAPAPAPAPAAPAEAKTPPAPQSTGPTLPPINHVFLIVLSDQGFDASFGHDSTAPYLAKTLTPQGELLSNYYAVTQGELANGMALISGQGPTLQTTQNCATFADVTPGTVDKDGQVIGDGCAYPAPARTIADTLVSGGQTWKAYVQGMESDCASPSATAAPPATTTATTPADPAVPIGGYASWRNPFVYFHSVTDTPLCAKNDVSLDQLDTDLKTPATTPSLSYIVPDLCHDGSDEPCAPGQPAGLPQADAFLKEVVPKIMGSDAYQSGGMIAITFDQAPQTGPSADQSACCDTPAYPNLPAAAAGTTPGTTTAPADPTATAPADPAAAPADPAATTDPAAPADPAATTTDPATTSPVDPAAAPAAPTSRLASPTATAAQFGGGGTPTTPKTPSTPAATTTTPAPTTTTTTPTTTPDPTATTPGSTTPTTPALPADLGPVSPTGGGGHVGLLLLSPYVEPGTTNVFSYYNHFSLLRSIEALFDLEQLGYSATPTLSTFDTTVYNAKKPPAG